MVNSLVFAGCVTCVPNFHEVADIFYCIGGPGFEVSLPGSSGYPGEVAPFNYCISWIADDMIPLPDT